MTFTADGMIAAGLLILLVAFALFVFRSILRCVVKVTLSRITTPTPNKTTTAEGERK